MNLSNDPTRTTENTARKPDLATKPRGRAEKGFKRGVKKLDWPDLGAERMNLSNDPTRKTENTARKPDPATKPRGRAENGSNRGFWGERENPPKRH